MICGKCGKQNNETDIYCSYCSSLLTASESSNKLIDKNRYENDLRFADPASQYIKPQIKEDTEEIDPVNTEGEQPFSEEVKHFEERRRRKRRRFAIRMASAILIVILTIAGISFFKKDVQYYYQAENAVNFYQDSNNGITYLLNSQGTILHEVTGFNGIMQTPDHSAAVLMENSIPYYVNSKKTEALGFATGGLNMSDNGKFIIYSTNGAIDTKSLYRYDVENGKEKLIDQTTDKWFAALNILPDGKTMTYATISPDDPVDVEAFMYKQGSKPESFGKNRVILAISYDTEYIYYAELEENRFAALYVLHNGTTRKLLDDFTNEQIFFNQNYTEILFTGKNRTFISVKGGEKIKVSDTPVTQVLIPKNCIFEASRVAFGNRYGIDSFRNKTAVFQSSDLGYINDDCLMEQISTSDDAFYGVSAVSEDGKHIIYQTTLGKMIKVSLKDNLHKEVLVDKLNSAAVSKDFSKVYYLFDHKLYCIIGKSEPQLLEDNVDAIYMNVSGDTLIFTKDPSDGGNVLYCTSDGKTINQVPETENFTGLSDWNGSLVYTRYENGKTSTYYNTQGADFVLLQGGDSITD